MKGIYDYRVTPKVLVPRSVYTYHFICLVNACMYVCALPVKAYPHEALPVFCTLHVVAHGRAFIYFLLSGVTLIPFSKEEERQKDSGNIKYIYIPTLLSISLHRRYF